MVVLSLFQLSFLFKSCGLWIYTVVGPLPLPSEMGFEILNIEMAHTIAYLNSK